MKNILNEKSSINLTGRILYTTKFVDQVDFENKNILNIGCGYGWFELDALKKGVSRIVGIEISAKDLEITRNNITDERVGFAVGNATDLPFDDNRFDVVTAWEVLEHLPKEREEKMFEEVNRVLKNNGIFYLSTPFFNFLSNLFDPAWYFGHRHYSLKELTKLAESNCFKIEKYCIKGGIWEMLYVLDMYISKWILRRAPVFSKLFKKKAEEEYNNQKNDKYDLFIKFKKINKHS